LPDAVAAPRSDGGAAAETRTQEVLVLDFGGQYSQLIARRVRECGVFSELLPHTISVDEIRARAPRALILSGGPASVYADGAPRLRTELLELGIPVLGICYGMQAMAHELGGRIEPAAIGEFGRSHLAVREPGRLLHDLPADQTCWMSHRDTIFEPPPGFTTLGSSTESPVAAFEDQSRALYGIQFHPEVAHTPYGTAILTTFLEDICACDMSWSAASVVEEQVRRIREQVGDGRVICGLSGGVDSSVAALLVHRAVGDQLTCVFVDHGLMRKNEGEQVISAFRDRFKIPLVAVDAEDRFLNRLAAVTEPEAKRKIIGEEFIRVFEEEAAKLGNPRYLVQGTLYSDVIESGGGHGAATIKSHRSAPCSRTRCGTSGWSLGCPSASSGASRSRARGLRSGSSAAKSRRTGSRSSATPITSSRMRSGAPASIASCGSPSACCPPTCGRSGCRATSGRTATWS
jgi:GMP synthase (glutamine-hydrolysing)